MPTSDLSLLESVSDPTPNVGDSITFTITLSNQGPDPATNVQVSDLLPAGLTLVSASPSQGTYTSAGGIWTVGSVSASATATLNIVARVDSAAALTNTATISHADQFDPNQANNSASLTEKPQRADLSLSESVSNPTPNVGDEITFTVTLSDQGPAPPRVWGWSTCCRPGSPLSARQQAKASTPAAAGSGRSGRSTTSLRR